MDGGWTERMINQETDAPSSGIAFYHVPLYHVCLMSDSKDCDLSLYSQCLLTQCLAHFRLLINVLR